MVKTLRQCIQFVFHFRLWRPCLFQRHRGSLTTHLSHHPWRCHRWAAPARLPNAERLVPELPEDKSPHVSVLLWHTSFPYLVGINTVHLPPSGAPGPLSSQPRSGRTGAQYKNILFVTISTSELTSEVDSWVMSLPHQSVMSHDSRYYNLKGRKQHVYLFIY